MSHLKWIRNSAIAIALLLGAHSHFALAENAHQVTPTPPGFSDLWAVFSPRGDKLAFARSENGVGAIPTVFVADLATGIIDTLVNLPTGFNPTGGLEWSPDGKQIAFARDNPGVGISVWIADVPGSLIPRIVGTTQGDPIPAGDFDALASDGTIFRCSLNGSTAITSTILGNLFLGPPPALVISCFKNDFNEIAAVLQNGDVWNWVANEGKGLYVGNILTLGGITAVSSTSAVQRMTMALPRPNPFNPTTTIQYTLGSPGHISIRIYDVSGRLVRALEDRTKPSGTHAAMWDGQDDHGENVASGMYFGRITFPDGTSSERKMTLLK